LYEIATKAKYNELIPEAREIAEQAEKDGKQAEAEAVRKAVSDILARPEHQWFESELKKKAD
jgi:hypothetical protein